MLVAYPHMGRNAERVAAIAALYPEVRVSAIIESKEQIRDWVDSAVDLFIDLNTGMNRTGITGNARAVAELADRNPRCPAPLPGFAFLRRELN